MLRRNAWCTSSAELNCQITIEEYQPQLASVFCERQYADDGAKRWLKNDMIVVGKRFVIN